MSDGMGSVIDRARGYIGRTPDGTRVWVEIELRRKGEGVRRETVEHGETAATGYLELAITGATLDKGRQRRYGSTGGGQCIDDARDIATRLASEVAPGWTRGELRRLAELWERWHLNGMRAACAHQAVVGDPGRGALDLTVPCPLTGYRYGSKWLVEELPDDVVASAYRFMSLLDGDHIDYV